MYVHACMCMFMCIDTYMHIYIHPPCGSLPTPDIL